MRRIYSRLAATGAIVAAIGCSDPIAQVSGRVEFTDGSAVTAPYSAIRFEPTDDSTAAVKTTASGRLGPDGGFELKRRKPGDGVYKGKYAVTFTAVADRGKASLIDEKYTRKATTPITVEVTRDTDDYVFQVERP